MNRRNFIKSASGLFVPTLLLPRKSRGSYFYAASGAAGYTAQLFVDFESGNNGDTINGAYMDANDHGTPPAAWGIDGIGGLVSTAETHPLITPVIVGGVTYDGVGTRSGAFLNANQDAVTFGWPEGQRVNSVIQSFWWKCTLPEPDLNNHTYDLCSLGNEFQSGVGSEFAVFQMQNWSAWAHSANGTGSVIAVHRDTWYKIDSQNIKTDGCYLSIRDTAGAPVGTSYVAHRAGSTNGVRFWELGHRRNNSGTGHCFYSSVASRWADQTTPFTIYS